jgi:putative transposase
MLTYKRKLKLTKAQQERIDSWMGVCRMLYNIGLEIQIAAWRNKQTYVHKYELSSQLKEIRKEYEWVADVPHDTLMGVIVRLDRSYMSFFKQMGSGYGKPKFKSKRDTHSIPFKICKTRNGEVWLPKLGWLKIFKDAPINGVPKTATIKKEPTGYFVTLACADIQRNIQNPDENQVVGIDLGVSHFAIDSNGTFAENPRHFAKHERKLMVENRSLARKKKGSSNWKKQAKRLALLHHKIGNVRQDFLHKLSTNYAKSYHTIFIEDLNIKGMSRNKNLSKHILDCGWGEFRRMLEYKTNVVAINPKHTSQTCNECGAVDAKSRVSQSEFVCTSCGVESNADENAAKNILGKGIAYVRERKAIA